MTSPRIYRYVITADKGMAPNPRGGVLSLATCKPVIRKGAQVGDWVLANRPSPHNRRVVWAGRVSATLPTDDYSRSYPEREDALYERAPSGEFRRIPGKLPAYHDSLDNLLTDTKGKVLIFDWSRCWYFGEDARHLPDELAHLAKRGIGQTLGGTREGDDMRLERWLESQERPGVHGNPADGWDSPECGGCAPVSKMSGRC